jgi:uncharacterized protein YggT (Ycf19 family)
LATIIHYACNIYQLGLVVYVVCSWIDHPSADTVRDYLARWFEPVLGPIRRTIPAIRTGYQQIDLSPIILFIGIAVLRSLLLSLLLPPF